MLPVIIGRFQTPYIHEGHKQIIKKAKEFGDVVIFVGCTAATGTDKNPLNFEVRAKMLSDYVKSDMIKPLWDMPSDKDWSDQIDNLIEEMGYKEATIFGGRDNSVEGYYSGKHKIYIISDYGDYSSTEIREYCKDLPNLVGREFRQGIIYHTQNRYPIVYSTVDVAVIDKFNGSILMGKKGEKFHLIGGFVDINDEDLKEAATRELFEETGLVVCRHDLKYTFSKKVEDNRYKNTNDSIMTHLFTTLVKSRPEININNIQDKEFKEFKWISIDDIDLVSNTHKPLILQLIKRR